MRRATTDQRSSFSYDSNTNLSYRSEQISEDHYRCHAVTYFFYRINKAETITFSLESIELRVLDPVATTRGIFNPMRARGLVSVIP